MKEEGPAVMPKMKTNRSAAKRFRVTGTGKIRRASAGKQHLMRGKSASRLRKLKKNAIVSSGDEKRIALLIPYKF
jgi:large subunit ribosomal protein L35